MADLNAANGAYLLLGRGEVYIDRLDANGARTGETLLGDCPGFSLSASAEFREAYNNTIASAALLRSTAIRSTCKVSIQCRELRSDIVAIALLGTKGTEAQTGTSVTNEDVTSSAVIGRWYQLGGDATPRRSVSSVTVTGNGGSPTYTLDTDYKLDTVRGRIGILGGAITAGSIVEVDYTYATISTGDKIVLNNATTINAFVRFIGTPASGPTWEAELWNVNLQPSGEIALIGDDYISFTLEGVLQDASTNHPTEPYGRLHRISG